MNVACTVACKFPSPQLHPLKGHSFWLKKEMPFAFAFGVSKDTALFCRADR